MTFADITAEMTARGSEASSARNGVWANVAYRMILNAHDWPFTVTATTGTVGAGGVAVPTFRKAIVVGDLGSTALPPGTLLRKITYEELAEDIEAEDIVVAGTPEFWWYDAVAGLINTYPKGGTIYARYYARSAPLSGVNEPAFDEEYHNLVVDRAMVEVYKDSSEFEAATALLNQYYVDLAAMARDYQVYSREHGYIQVPDAYDG
jgi:hypothetical protein